MSQNWHQMLDELVTDSDAFVQILVSIIEPKSEIGCNLEDDEPCARYGNFRSVQYPLDESSATHILHLTSTNYDTLGLYVHGGLLSQCSKFSELIRFPSNRKAQAVYFLDNVPHLSSFPIVLQWLYTHSKGELVSALKVETDRGLLGFVQNCRFLGISDASLVSEVKGILEDRYGVSTGRT